MWQRPAYPGGVVPGGCFYQHEKRAGKNCLVVLTVLHHQHLIAVAG